MTLVAEPASASASVRDANTSSLIHDLYVAENCERRASVVPWMTCRRR